MKTKPLRAILAICIIFAGILIVDPLLTNGSAHGFGLIPLAYAGTSGNSTGNATVGNAVPVITVPMLLTAAEADANNTDLDVWVEYRTNLTVTDDNQLYDLLNVTWYIFEDTATNPESADANDTHYTFLYLNSTDAFTEVGPGGGHIITGSCTKPADRSATSGEYLVAFKLAKIANHTGSRSWRVNATVFDGASDTDNDQTLVFGVNYYFECTVDDATHGWTGLAAGNTNVTITSPVDLDIDVTCTSNAIFKLQAKSWNASLTSGGDTITIGNVLIHEDTLGSAANLTVGYLDIGGLDDEAAAEAVGKAFVLWINVPAGTPAGSYIYVLAVQGIEK